MSKNLIINGGNVGEIIEKRLLGADWTIWLCHGDGMWNVVASHKHDLPDGFGTRCFGFVESREPDARAYFRDLTVEALETEN